MRTILRRHIFRWPLILVLLGLVVLPVLGGCRQAQEAAVTAEVFPRSFAEVVEKAMPSVVYIFVEEDTGFPGQFATASGSGVIMSPDGLILTNKHVVGNALRVEVTLQDRRVYEVPEGDIWLDKLLDLAVIKIDAQGLPAAEFGDPAEIKVGDWVIALGHPLGLSPEEGGATVTVGIVSNLGRSFSIQGVPYYDVIQTDAAINPGNSGGPLVNLEGKVIGINSAGSSEAQNINYAINVSTARRVYNDIVKYGRVIRPYLGAIMSDFTPSLACEFCLAKRVGAVIVDVETGSPADLAGLQRGDIIVRFGEEDVISAAQMIKKLWQREVGERVKIVYWRGETENETTATLTERPD
jgi:serine protease Do